MGIVFFLLCYSVTNKSHKCLDNQVITINISNWMTDTLCGRHVLLSQIFRYQYTCSHLRNVICVFLIDFQDLKIDNFQLP